MDFLPLAETIPSCMKGHANAIFSALVGIINYAACLVNQRHRRWTADFERLLEMSHRSRKCLLDFCLRQFNRAQAPLHIRHGLAAFLLLFTSFSGHPVVAQSKPAVKFERYEDFMASTRTAKAADFQASADSQVPDADEFEKMRQQVLEQYDGVDVSRSFIKDGADPTACRSSSNRRRENMGSKPCRFLRPFPTRRRGSRQILRPPPRLWVSRRIRPYRVRSAEWMHRAILYTARPARCRCRA